MLEQARQIEEQLVAWRREIHQDPELGFQEHHTAAKISDVLSSLGYRVRTGVGKTGVVGEIGEGSPIIGVRADMDALPLQEANPVPYVSRNPGVMHACGHDAHVAIALGTATLLAKQNLPGSVRFLFQPSEEVGDEEGISGAPRMIDDGAMEGVDSIIALHMDSELATGAITNDAGMVSAGVDTFYATILGKGGHGASPEETVDPIYLSGLIVLAINGIVSRKICPIDPAVVSLGSIKGGETSNVIPDRVELIGTIRFISPEVQEKIHQELHQALAISRSFGGDYELKLEIGYPPMYNEEQVVELIDKVADDILGKGHNIPQRLNMGAEDFGFFLKHAPGAMFMLGCKIEGDMRVAHSPTFDIDERSLPYGVAMLGETVLRLMRQPIVQCQAES
ncbi:MAG: amidohydrolase [Anaerolineales bacterium]|nr:amidohydrolase [Anaerolineales bacterium]